MAAWLPRDSSADLLRDVLAGAVVAALAVPQSLGYAGIAGIPVQVGLYAIPLALVAYGALGSSSHLVAGPVSTVSVLPRRGGAAPGDPRRAARPRGDEPARHHERRRALPRADPAGERDVELHLVRVFRSPREALRRSGFTDRLGPDRMWHRISAAVRAARQQLEAAGVAQAPLADGDSLEDYTPGEERSAPQQTDRELPWMERSVMRNGSGERGHARGRLAP
jgi:hypothetical protein